MLRCSKEAFALCPTAHLCGDREESTFKEGSDCDKFNQAVEKKTQMDGRWISVTDRLPQRGQEVIAYDGGVLKPKVYACLFWDKEFDSWARVTHWMPLPEPPKEGIV